MFIESVIWLQNITWQPQNMVKDVGEEKWNTIVWLIL